VCESVRGRVCVCVCVCLCVRVGGWGGGCVGGCVHTHRFINYMPIAYSAVTLAVQKKETMDVPIFNFIRLQVTVMVSKKDSCVE